VYVAIVIANTEDVFVIVVDVAAIVVDEDVDACQFLIGAILGLLSYVLHMLSCFLGTRYGKRVPTTA
jgi:hypothetical protein